MAFHLLNVLLTINETVSGSQNLVLVVNRLDTVIISISAVIIGILWIPIAISFFSSDENKRFEAKTRLKNAIIGTLIYVLALSGVLYAVFNYIVTGA